MRSHLQAIESITSTMCLIIVCLLIFEQAVFLCHIKLGEKSRMYSI